ncbi:ATP-dependent RecD-like DNA helicase [Thiolapillus sp.]|uniref:SF1B family DNA helicase RecD2 n=1 Tax=Thiolapillus sp. TaxID=2017437 RepID=UPI003AF5A582
MFSINKTTVTPVQQDTRFVGRVKRVIFRNPDNGFSILDVETDHPEAQNGLVKVKGSSDLRPGNECECIGRFEHHPKHGYGFEARAIVPIIPDTDEGLVRYFNSGIVKGISGTMGKRLVDHFGTHALNLLSRADPALMAVPGVKDKTFERITEAWKQHEMVYRIMRALKEYDIGNADAWLIYKTWGEKALPTIKEHPYRLTSIRGIGFAKADRVALSMNVDKDSRQRVLAGIRHVLSEAEDEGHTRLDWGVTRYRASKLLGVDPETVSETMVSAVADDILAGYKIDEKAWVANKSMYDAEVRIAERIADIMVSAPPWEETPWTMPDGMDYSPSQRAAIQNAVTSKFMVMTGGPGTGKTTVTRSIIDILENQFNANVLLCAPTGRAAKRLSEATGRDASTIHMMLNYNPQQGFMYDAMNPLQCDAVVVDEASMLDTRLMRSVLNAIPNHAMVLLVGDADQLPSVGAGNLLHDLINSNRVPVARLTEIHRQAQDSRIITNSHAMNRGEMPVMSEDPDSDFSFHSMEKEGIPEYIVDLVTRVIPQTQGIDPNEVQVLTPMKGYECGTRALNVRLQEKINPPATEKPETHHGDAVYRLHDRVMQTRNDYKNNVFNGDMGKVIAVNPDEKLVTVQFDGHDRPVEIAGTQLDQLLHAYAVTVHKSQGSEYKAVVIPATTSHYVMLNRNLYYTAVTRGKKQVHMVGQPEAVRIAVSREGQARHTGLQLQLHGMLDPIQNASSTDDVPQAGVRAGRMNTP